MPGPLNLLDATRAPLVMAFLLLALLPVALINIPVQNHGVSLDLGVLPEEARSTGALGAVANVRATRRTAPAWRRVQRLTLPMPSPFPATPAHRLELTAAREMLFDGRAIDRTGLRVRLDRLQSQGGGWVDVRPEPYARYEDFAEVLAVFARAGFDRMILDNRAYVRSIDPR